MNAATWLVQILLAFLFLMHGWGMVTTPDRLRQRIPYIFDLSPSLRIFIGSAEMAGGAGLILPGLTGILPVLTPLAAVGLALVMVGSIGFHVRRDETRRLGLNGVLLMLSLWVAIARWFLVPLG